MDSCSVIMADSISDLEFTLPAEFLTEDERVVDRENSIFSFPVEFPYEFDSFGPVDSTETESSDEDDFIVGLTQQLAVDHEKKWIKSESPKSTLCGIGSWSMSSNGSTKGEMSPPTTPTRTKYDTEPIYAGAGDVLRMKNGVKDQTTGFYSSQRFMYGVSQLQNQDQLNLSYSVWGKQQLKAGSHLRQNQIQNRGIRSAVYENGRFVRPLGLPQSAWPPLQVQQNKHRFGSNSSSVFPSGSGAKRGCAGTGVFLPRRFDNSTDYNKISDFSTTVLLPAKVEDKDRQGKINGAFASKHDASMGTRNWLLTQQKGDMQKENAVKYEICLPQEWIY